jgi:RimJ/RimL family protein N-acetyltransferase
LTKEWAIMQVTVQVRDYLWRPLTDSEDDTEFVLLLRNKSEAQEAFFTSRLSREEHLRFVHAPQRREEINWIIEKAGQRVGASGIYHIDWKNRRAEAGRVVVTIPELYILNLWVSSWVVFEHLALNKLLGDALASNNVVNQSLERLGAVREGVLREHIIKDGMPRDVYLYGTLASAWQKVKPVMVNQMGQPQITKHLGDDF